jgi:signal transduction histidine kinase
MENHIVESQSQLKDTASFFSKLHISVEIASALFTWLFVSGSALYFMLGSDKISSQRVIAAIVLFATYLVFWMYLSRERNYKNEKGVRAALLALTFCNVIAIYFVVPFVYTAIFMIIWSAALPYFIKPKLAFLLSPLWSSTLYLVYGLYWGFSGMFVSAMLFWTFNLFALVMVTTAIKEKQSREKVEMINLELISTQQLLGQAAGQVERIRIARNIHDLLGHHLTALTINLQVASRQLDKLNVASEEKAISQKGAIKESIEQCHSLSKLLLSDVREAVSDIRIKSSLKLDLAIKAMTERLPHLKVTLHYPNEINIDDVNIADVLTKCVQESITNTLKHSRGKAMDITFSQHNNELNLKLQSFDSNQLTKGKLKISAAVNQINLGNGLKGMQERLKQINGNVIFSMNEHGFATDIKVPVNIND